MNFIKAMKINEADQTSVNELHRSYEDQSRRSDAGH
ncbi:hypothetical protein J2Z37_004061 [Ammoniphilus resinae]|uniref:Uncharacterized protein n=1 Tax=Ammoniphilus resinae TaxID=861532 RepID=A0ABS4GUW7_9BACL|nr:hypothetical protein [Ammoniphilus resinae]